MEFTGYSHNKIAMEEALKIAKIDSPEKDEQCEEDVENEYHGQSFGRSLEQSSRCSLAHSSKEFSEDNDMKLTNESMESSIKRKVIDELIEQLKSIRDNSCALEEYRFKHAKKSVKKFCKTNKL